MNNTNQESDNAKILQLFRDARALGILTPQREADGFTIDGMMNLVPPSNFQFLTDGPTGLVRQAAAPRIFPNWSNQINRDLVEFDQVNRLRAESESESESETSDSEG